MGETVKISYVDQNRAGIDPKKSVWEVVSDGLDYMKVGESEIPSRAYVASFGFKGPDQQKPAGILSGGERNRLNLALTLKQGGNLLLLDEPTNDLDVETLESLEEALLAFPGCVVVTSHDRWFLDRIATHILRGRAPTRTPALGTGSRATSRTTRKTAWSASARRPRARTASTASSRATKRGTEDESRRGLRRVPGSLRKGAQRQRLSVGSRAPMNDTASSSVMRHDSAMPGAQRSMSSSSVSSSRKAPSR